jgi:hypothetical protein
MLDSYVIFRLRLNYVGYVASRERESWEDTKVVSR